MTVDSIDVRAMVFKLIARFIRKRWNLKPRNYSIKNSDFLQPKLKPFRNALKLCSNFEVGQSRREVKTRWIIERSKSQLELGV